MYEIEVSSRCFDRVKQVWFVETFNGRSYADPTNDFKLKLSVLEKLAEIGIVPSYRIEGITDINVCDFDPEYIPSYTNGIPFISRNDRQIDYRFYFVFETEVDFMAFKLRFL